MEKLLIILLYVFGIAIAILTKDIGALAVIFCAICSLIVVYFINKTFKDEEQIFLRNLFLAALLARVALAVATYVFNLQNFFGGDSITYDNAGFTLYISWFGNPRDIGESYNSLAYKTAGSGFGMPYIVAAIYSVLGRNPLAVQFLNCVLGAATSSLIYMCAKNIFNNIRVARLSAILVAFFPSLILWSSQGLKDGIICFLLALSINLLFSLQKRLNYLNIFLLMISLVGIYTLRFYIFFAFMVAVLGNFFLGTQKKVSSIGKQFVVLVVIALGLTYLGVLRNVQTNLDQFGNLKALQNSRLDQVRSAESGFGEDIDVSTPAGALQAIPIGLVYLLLAPFPWQAANLRQTITLPEVFIWWAMIPLMFYGIWYTLKNKLRPSIAVMLLTSLLTIAYSIFQGNVGTAYRMRAQMQIFYLIFVAVGWVLWQERRENRMLSSRTRISLKPVR